jgi:hypothetical protein
MHWFTVDYSKDRSADRWVLMNRGFFLSGLPRVILLCRLIGHRPVVDGYDSKYGPEEERRARWINCGQCGIRPEPQGWLDPDQWHLGQRYTGPFNPTQPMSPTVRKQLIRLGHDAGIRLPGDWSMNPESAVGAQVIIGRSNFVSAQLKVGSGSSEQCLAASISLGPLGAIYVHTEDHGRFIQRRFNGNRDLSTESRVTGVDLHRGRLNWKLWAPRDSSSKDDPWWWRGSIPIDPRHYLLGKVTNRQVSVTAKAPATVRMPDGEAYEVTVRLECWSIGRQRGRRREHWTLDWDCKPGIPYRAGDSWFGGSQPVQHLTTDTPNWPQVAAEEIAARCVRDRARYGYSAPTSA